MPAERYASAEEMAAELRALCEAAKPAVAAVVEVPDEVRSRGFESRVPDFDDDLTAAPFELIPRDAMLVGDDELLQDDDGPVTARRPPAARVSAPRALPPPPPRALPLPPPRAATAASVPWVQYPADSPTESRKARMPSLIPMAFNAPPPPSPTRWERAMVGVVAAVALSMLLIGAAIRVGSRPDATAAGDARPSAARVLGVFEDP